MLSRRISFRSIPFLTICCRKLCLIHNTDSVWSRLSAVTADGRNHDFHCFPSFSKIVCLVNSAAVFFSNAVLTRNVVSHSCHPNDVWHSFWSCFMTVVRSFNNKFFNCMVRNAKTAWSLIFRTQVAVFFTVCNNVIIQRQESLSVSWIAVRFFFGSSAGWNCRHNSTSCKCCWKNRCNNSFLLFKNHHYFPSHFEMVLQYKNIVS